MHKLDAQLERYSNKYSLRNKRALITGASRGIGKSIALTFAENGADLILVSRNEKLLQEVKEEIEGLNNSVKCQILICDLKDTANFIQRIEAAIGDIEGPDILINNAGTFAIDNINNKDREIWRDTLAINLTAAYQLCCYASKFMVDRGWGRIINVSSISAEGEKYALSYSTVKAGLLGLTRALALELAKFGVTVNAICPSWVETEMAMNQLKDPRWCELHNIDPALSVEIARLSTPQERLLQAQEVAHLTAFLCSQEAKGITGQSINICGGLSLI